MPRQIPDACKSRVFARISEIVLLLMLASSCGTEDPSTPRDGSTDIVSDAAAGDGEPSDTGIDVQDVPRPDAPFPELSFARDYFPGTTDPNGNLLGGVEVNYLAAFEQRLYATVSTWKQEGWNTGMTTGPQVLVKPRSDAPWQLEYSFGPFHARAEHLRSVTFTTDANGTRLDPPARVLLASATGASREISVYARREAGVWEQSLIRGAETVWDSEIRTIIDHIDAVTGVHHLFIAANEGTIYRGAYDPTPPGRVVWSDVPELDHRTEMPDGQRMPAAAVLGGILYWSLEMDPSVPGRGGLYRRVDGPAPRWEHVYEWSHAAEAEEARIGHKLDRQIRGLTAGRSPQASSPNVLLAGRGFTGEVLAIDPRTRTAEVELDVTRYFSEAFGMDAVVRQIAANDFVTVQNPTDSRAVQLVGLWLSHPAGIGTPLGNSGWYLVRYPDGTYSHGRVWDPAEPVPNEDVAGGLRTVRSIVASPFPDEAGRAFYVGGFDSGLSTMNEAFGYTAWIYRASW
ncbi:MAG: hypothetical protein AAGF12_03925 [Myxococcota bacterium]